MLKKYERIENHQKKNVYECSFSINLKLISHKMSGNKLFLSIKFKQKKNLNHTNPPLI